MKRNSSIFNVRRSAILAVVVIAVGLVEPAYCEPEPTVLFLQQSPAAGGTITPSSGIHRFEMNTDVTLTALPSPGYQFVYWLGDVSNPRANSTVVHLDAPKIIIAVFERAEYEFLPVEMMALSMPIGGLMTSSADYSRQGYAGGRPRRVVSKPSPPEPDEFPAPVPEPTTVVLVLFGSLFTFTRRKGKHKPQINSGK